MISVEEPSEVRHVVDVFRSTAHATLWFLKIEQTLRSLIVLGSNQLADLESICKRRVFLPVHSWVLVITAILLECILADRAIWPEYSRRVHWFYEWCKRFRIHSFIIVVCQVRDRHTSAGSLRCLVLPVCIRKMSLQSDLLNRLLLIVSFILVRQDLVILLLHIIFCSNPASTFSRTTNGILLFIVRFSAKINAIRVNSVLTSSSLIVIGYRVVWIWHPLWCSTHWQPNSSILHHTLLNSNAKPHRHVVLDNTCLHLSWNILFFLPH